MHLVMRATKRCNKMIAKAKKCSLPSASNRCSRASRRNRQPRLLHHPALRQQHERAWPRAA